jgi:hypothetical protein
LVGVTSPRFWGGEKKLGTGDFREGSGVGGGKSGADFFSGDGGSGILAAVFTDPDEEPMASNGARRFVGDGGGLPRTVSSFSSPYPPLC